MKIFLVFFIFASSFLLANEDIYSVAAYKLAIQMLKTDSHGFAHLEHWVNSKPYFYACKVNKHFGLLTSYYPVRVAAVAKLPVPTSEPVDDAASSGESGKFCSSSTLRCIYIDHKNKRIESEG